MVIVNGYMQQVQTTGGGFVNGRPQPVTETLGEMIPCNIEVSRSYRVNKDGENNAYQQAAYNVIIDSSTTFDAKEVRLQSANGTQYGRCKVQSVIELDSVKALKIFVERYAD